MTAPRAMNGEHLILSHFTLHRNHPLDDRIRIAGSAGVDGIGVFAGQYGQLLDDGWTAQRVHELLAEHGVALAEVEALSGWGAVEPTDRYMDFERLVWQMVDEFEARYVQAIGPTEGTRAEAAKRFGALCDRAAEHGAIVGLEFLPFTNIVTAADAVEIVESADRPNGGVCVDIWHHARGANDLDLIRAIPNDLIVGIQMSDGTAQPALDDYKDDCLRHRQPPGTGDFEAVDFVRTLLGKGVDVPWSIEVCNDDVWSGDGAHAHVTDCVDALRHVISTAQTR